MREREENPKGLALFFNLRIEGIEVFFELANYSIQKAQYYFAISTHTQRFKKHTNTQN